ncbi:MAG: hypothetical protein RLZZ258_1434, partial [Actinomycetota bacterium]
DHETATTPSVYGITAGFEGNTRASIKTAGGAISISGTASGGATNSYGLSLGSGMASTSTGAMILSGSSSTAGTASYGVRVGATYNLATQSGNIGVTGTAQGTTTSYGVSFSSGNATTTSGNFTVNGTSTAVSANTNIGVALSGYPVTTNSGAVDILGTTPGATTSFATALNFNSSNIKTTTGAIELQGLSLNTVSGAATGINLGSSSITSGDSATSTSGGDINITAKVGDVASGGQMGMTINSATIDSFNGAVTVLVNDPFTTTNSSRNSLSLNATNTWAATSATFDLTVNGLQGGKILMQETSSTLNIGGTNSHANVTIRTDAWHKSQISVLPVTNIDTDGSFVVEPIGTSFLADMFNTGSPTTDSMKVNFSPSSRTTSMTIGKSGNTRAVTLQNSVTMSTNSTLKVYSGNLTSSNTVSVGTLAVESSGNVSLTGASNSFANVAVTRGAASTLSITNTATSWNAGTYGGVTGVYGVPAAFKASGTPPSTAAVGSTMATYSILPTDAYGYAISSANTHFSDAVTATASIKSGASTSLGGTTSQTGTAGAALAFNDLTFSNPGVHTLAFDATGYSQYVSPNITVNGGAPTISLSYFSGTNSTTFVSNATTASPTLTKNSNGTATYTSNSISVCTVVSNTGVITTKTPGTCSISVSVAADSTYIAGSQTVSITIDKMAQSALTITSTAGSFGTVLTLATSGGNAGAVSYVVDSGTCSLATSTTLNLGAVGDSCFISATRAGDATYSPVSSASTSIATNKGTQATLITPSGVTISYQSAGLDLSALTYSGGSGSGSITFSTSTSGCSISGTTLTSTNSVGGSSCSITAVKGGDASYNTGSASVFSIAIAKINQSAISVTSTSVTYGSTLSLTATGGDGSGALTWSVVSGNCTISTTTLTPTGAGSCVIKVSKAASTNYNIASSSDTTVNIAKANQAALVWNLGSTSVAYLGSLSLATSGGSGSGSVVYSVSQNSACSIVGSTLYPSSVGSVCDITATKVADANYNSADTATQSITVTPIAQAALSFTSANTMTYGQTLTVLAVGGSGSGVISYTVSNAGTTGCSLNAGTLSVTASGTCVISATRAASTNYQVSSAQAQSITVNKASKTVSFTSSVPANPIVSGTYNVAAAATSGEAVTFTIGSGSCAISGTTVIFNGAGNCRVDANSIATSQYLAAPVVSQTITVGQQNQTLTFKPATLLVSQKTFGDLAFNAEAISSVSSLNPTYSRGNNTTNNACLVNSAGLVTIVAVGRCEILADQAGDADTSAASQIAKTFEVIADYANAPTIVSVSASHESITAAFIAPSYTGGAAVSGYEMAAVYSGGQVVNSGCSVIAGNQQSCTIGGLTNGTPYTIKIAAINARGVGAYSSLSPSRVPATNPAAVGALTVVPDNTTLNLAWLQPVSLGGGTFDSYRIFIKPAGTASYPTTYVTVNSQSTLGYQFTNLVNGQAYDVRVVTVTTANTLALESNTAEAAETPRTVPDAPAALQIFELNGKVIISWTSPNSDGGSAVTAYQATLGGQICVLASPLDTTCEITSPTASGVYPIEVKAQNAAGLGTAASTTFSRAGVASSGSSSSNGARPWMEVLGLNLKKLQAEGGQILTVTHRNMDSVTQVLVDGVEAKIVAIDSNEMQILMPPHKEGSATLVFMSPAAKLTFQDAITYSAGKVSILFTTISKYIEGKSSLSAKTKTLLSTLIKKHPTAVSVTCIGYQSLSYNRPIDAKVAKQRAVEACNYLKSKNPKLVTKTAVARTKLTGVASRKLEIQLRETKYD